MSIYRTYAALWCACMFKVHLHPDQSLNLTSNNHQGAINLVDRCSWWFQPFSPFCLWCANPLASITPSLARSWQIPRKIQTRVQRYECLPPHSLHTSLDLWDQEANANNVVFDAFSEAQARRCQRGFSSTFVCHLLFIIKCLKLHCTPSMFVVDSKVSLLQKIQCCIIKGWKNI